MAPSKYDLEDRLLEYACKIVKIVEKLPKTRTGNHIANQLLGSGTSPYPHHGEAQAAESKKDFVHKMRVCLKELREAYRWLKLIDRLSLISPNQIVSEAISETEELKKIFYTSIKTAQNKKGTN